MALGPYCNYVCHILPVHVFLADKGHFRMGGDKMKKGAYGPLLLFTHSQRYLLAGLDFELAAEAYPERNGIISSFHHA